MSSLSLPSSLRATMLFFVVVCFKVFFSLAYRFMFERARVHTLTRARARTHTHKRAHARNEVIMIEHSGN